MCNDKKTTVSVVQVLSFPRFDDIFPQWTYFRNIIILFSIQSNAFNNVHIVVCHLITNLCPKLRSTRLVKCEIQV